MEPVAPNLDLRRRPQAWKAYKRILQYASGRGLGKGDRLPVQSELREALQLCGNTHRAAMMALIANGALAARKGVGTVLADPDAIGRVSWTIGLAAMPNDTQVSSAFAADLFVRIQSALVAAGCRYQTYHRFAWSDPSPMKEIIGLVEDVAAGDLDGLIALTPVNGEDWAGAVARGVPIVHTHWMEKVPCGVLVDQRAFAAQAVAELAARGCRSLAAVMNRDRTNYLGGFWDGFDDGVRLAGAAGESLAKGLDLNYRDLYAVAPRLAHALLHRKREERPDGLVISDDFIAAHLAHILRESGDYRPMMAVQTNLQQPRLFPLPIVSFEVDIEEIAQRTVKLLLERVRNPATPQRLEWVSPRLSHRQITLSPLPAAG